jgi:fructoselysine-6-P-deglycase FrlB-like protein
MPPSLMHQELSDQPTCWRRVAAMKEELSSFFGGTGGRMALVGCGTSFHMAASMARLREEAGYGASDPFPASEVPTGRRYPRLVAVSRSGTTTEVLRAVEGFGDTAEKLVVTASGDSELARRADRLLVLDFADERSVVQTRFATSALVAMRAQVGHPIDAIADEAEAALSVELPDGIDSVHRIVFTSTGWASPLAGEAALKMTEAAAVCCQSYPALELRHGPLSACDRSTLIWAVGPVDGSLLADARRTGAVVVGGERDPLAELVVVQRAAELLARQAGRDPDNPPHLGRSVILR